MEKKIEAFKDFFPLKLMFSLEKAKKMGEFFIVHNIPSVFFNQVSTIHLKLYSLADAR